jgi:hypothetical protein
MKPPLSRARREESFLFVFGLFGPNLATTHPLALVLDHCGAAPSARQRSNAKVSYLSSAQRNWLKVEQRNNWQGPAVLAGRIAVYAGCKLEPMQWSATGMVIID